jgi:predicted DNA repair protein MutK
MTIALATIESPSFWLQAVTLAVVGIFITVAVYGAVALIVKMDDVGLHLAATASTSGGRALGRGLVKAMPKLMAFLSTVGTAAMLWVGGNIVLHGLEVTHLWAWPYDTIHHIAEAAAHAAPVAQGFVTWVVTAALDGVFGLILGLALIPLATRVIGPVWAALSGQKSAAH